MAQFLGSEQQRPRENSRLLPAYYKRRIVTKSSHSPRRRTDLHQACPGPVMKRVILEWGSIVSAVMALAILALWGFSRFVDQSSYHLRFPTSRSVQDDLHLVVGDGDLTLCDQFDVDASGNVRPLIVDKRRPLVSDILRRDRVGQFTIPGLDLRYYRFGLDGYLIWSVRVSLLFVVALLVLLAVLFRRGLVRLRRSIGKPGDPRTPFAPISDA